MALSRPYRLLAPDFGRLWVSFPVPAAIAIGAAALAVVDSSDDVGAILVIAATAWPAALAASLYAQGKGAGRAVSLAGQIVAGLAATGIAMAGQTLGLAVQYYFAGLALLCLAAPVPRLREPDSYWVWAERFCVAAVFAAAVGLVGWLASVATLYSAEHLFGLFGSGLTGRLAVNLAVIFFVAVAPVAYLAIQPPIADETLAADEKDFVRRAIAALASWALAPFVLIYSAMLWLYAAKIGLDRALPDGQIGWMVGAFGFSALSTIILMAPQRRDGPAQTRLLWRVWPYLALAPLALLGFALYERIEAYGLTADRYMAALLGGLCAANAGVALVSREAVLRFAPAAGALALILASFGPWGAVATAERWQRNALLDIYAAHGRLVDARLVLDGGAPAMSEEESRRCNAAVETLKETKALAPLVAEKDRPQIEDASNLCPVPDEKRSEVYNRYWNNGQWIAPERIGGLRVVGYFTLGSSSKIDERGVKIDCNETRVTVTLDSEPPAIFDMSDLVRAADPKTRDLKIEPLLKPTSGNGRVFFLLQNLTIVTRPNGASRLDSLYGFLMRRD